MVTPPEDPKRAEFTKTLFDLRAAEFGRCFAPPPLCPNPPIKAHSVQNARSMDLLAVDGHVVAPTMRFQLPRPPLIDFTRVGRNQATTFLGLCHKHDREVFAPIETKPLDTGDPEHLFLLAYRAVYFEVHATCAAAWMLQLGYQKRVELGYDPRDEPSPAGMLAVGRMAIAYDTYQYKELLDSAFSRNDFGALRHDVFIHDVDRPTVAACVLFSLDDLWNGSDVVRVCLNILPLDIHRTAIVLSYIQPDAGFARAELSAVLHSHGTSQRYEVSRRLLNHSQNFVLAPDYFASWPDSKRTTVLDYFRRTAIHNDLAYENQDLYLF